MQSRQSHQSPLVRSPSESSDPCAAIPSEPSSCAVIPSESSSCDAFPLEYSSSETNKWMNEHKQSWKQFVGTNVLQIKVGKKRKHRGLQSYLIGR
jgi:hypothetical protein